MEQQQTTETETETATKGDNGSESKQQTDDTATKQSTDETSADKPAEQPDTGTAEKASSGGAAGEKHATKAELMEKGSLYFFYRPKVDAKEVKGAGDASKFYILMSPEGAMGEPAKEDEAEAKRGEEREATEATEGGKQHRLLVVSSKTLPGLHQRARNPWYEAQHLHNLLCCCRAVSVLHIG